MVLKAYEGDSDQTSRSARQDMFMLGFDVFSLDVYVKDELYVDFSENIILGFDLSGFKYDQDKFRAYSYNNDWSIWKKIEESHSLVSGRLIVDSIKSGEYALFKISNAEISEEKNELVKNEISEDTQIKKAINEASVVYESGKDLKLITSHNNVAVNAVSQGEVMEKYTMKMVENSPGLTINEIYAVNNFIVYGTESTKILGTGERAGAVNSYKQAFGKLPRTNKDWEDVLKISVGRWPNERNSDTEKKAKEKFYEVYKREANMDQANDNAAVTVISYGLRPSSRNMDSEKAAIKIFKGIFNYNPLSALDWDVVRAIAYSGAIR